MGTLRRAASRALGQHAGALGIGQALVGLAAGLGLALLAGTLISKMLYRVHPFDQLTLVTAALVVGSSAVAACLLPDRRAARVDPMVALRAE